MAIDQRVWQLIREGARRRGLDPRAVGAVALSEGGLRYGAVGDAGTSFGPFQLHVGGALPRGRGASWANSPAGINYALDQMAKVAGGLTGRAAIANIVRRFERPAAPGAEIQRALGHYRTLGGAAMDMIDAVPGQQKITKSKLLNQPQVQAPTFRQVWDPGKMGQNILSQFAQTGSAQLGTLPGIVAKSWTKVQVPASPPIAEAKVRTQGGTTVPAGPIGHTNPKIAQAIQVATNAIGTPYVWGGAGPKGFDCSGLIEYAFEQAGIPTPGRLTTGTAIKLGRRVNFKGLRPGDWLVRHDAKQQHMVMYVGNGQVVAAPRTGELVQFQPAKNFMGAGWQARRYP